MSLSMEPVTYNSLEQIQQRKDALKADIQAEGSQISTLWHELTEPRPASTKGELVANLISNSITAIDAFLLVRKLMKTYGTLSNVFSRKKNKK